MIWQKHTIYWTIGFALIFGMTIGSLLTQKGFEPREEFEVFTGFDQAKIIFVITAYSITAYLAGTEYHELKRKIKKD